VWIPASLFTLFSINKETVDSLRLENAELKARDSVLERELLSTKIMSDWLRLQFNSLSAERSILIAKAYPGLNLPVPEIARTRSRVADNFDPRVLFEDQSELEHIPDDASPFTN